MIKSLHNVTIKTTLAIFLLFTVGHSASADEWSLFLENKKKYREGIRNAATTEIDNIYATNAFLINDLVPRSAISVEVQDSSSGEACYDLPEIAFLKYSKESYKIIICNEGIEVVTYITMSTKLLFNHLGATYLSIENKRLKERIGYDLGNISKLYKRALSETAHYYINHYQGITKPTHLLGKHPQTSCPPWQSVNRVLRGISLQGCTRAFSNEAEELISARATMEEELKFIETIMRTASEKFQNPSLPENPIPIMEKMLWEFQRIAIKYAIAHEIGHIIALVSEKENTERNADKYAIQVFAGDNNNGALLHVGGSLMIFWENSKGFLHRELDRKFIANRMDSFSEELICNNRFRSNIKDKYVGSMLEQFKLDACNNIKKLTGAAQICTGSNCSYTNSLPEWVFAFRFY